MLLANELRKYLRPVLAGDDLIHAGERSDEYYARPRVIRGTRVKPLPLLPSGPGGVCSRPLHEARSLTTTHAIRSKALFRLGKESTHQKLGYLRLRHRSLGKRLR